MSEPEERPHYTPFDQLSGEELKEAMIMHIRMGFIMKNPGRTKEADKVARDLVSRLTVEQMNQIHPHTFFTNKNMGTVPENPYLLALKLLGEE